MNNRAMGNSLLDSSRIEQKVLGTILVYPETIEECVNAGLEPECFFNPTNQNIYRAILQIYRSHGVISEEDIMQRLVAEANAPDPWEYMGQLIELTITSVGHQHDIAMLMDIYQRRRLIAVAENVIQLCHKEAEQDIVLDEAERTVLEITKTRRGSEFASASQVIKQVDSELNDLLRGIHKKSLVTGYSALDQLTGSFKDGELIILAARPAMGKTAFALNLAYQVALRNKGAVAIFSLEMPETAVMKRIISSISKVNGQKLNSGNLSTGELTSIRQAEDIIQEQSLFIDDTSLLTMGQIFSKCRKLKSSEREISLIVLDYLQLIQGSQNRRENRVQEITEISRNLKILAKEMECPVIALSQLSRKVEERMDHEPQLADLRESGSIEQDADMVLFLYRKSYYDNEEIKGPVDVVDVFLKKNRNGITGKIQLAFEKEYSKFSSVLY